VKEQQDVLLLWIEANVCVQSYCNGATAFVQDAMLAEE